METAIEAELLKRLQAGTYGDIYNFPTAQYEKALEQAVGEEGMQQPLEYVEGDDESEEEVQCLLPTCSLYQTAPLCIFEPLPGLSTWTPACRSAQLLAGVPQNRQQLPNAIGSVVCDM